MINWREPEVGAGEFEACHVVMGGCAEDSYRIIFWRGQPIGEIPTRGAAEDVIVDGRLARGIADGSISELVVERIVYYLVQSGSGVIGRYAEEGYL